MPDSLEVRAREFAADLTRTVQAVVGLHCPPFEATARGDSLAVAQVPAEGIVLSRRGEPLMRLEAAYLCSWDKSGSYLKVEWSQIGLYPAEESETVPYFRYEYERKGAWQLPDAHLHVHDDPDHRSRLSELMLRAGDGTRRARRRLERERGNRQDLHFPLGGDRFRPSLEDVMQILIEEFGVDKQPEWRAVLESAREEWRVRQVCAAVRDAPEDAVRVLVEDLGYRVEPPVDGHPRRNTRGLRAI